MMYMFIGLIVGAGLGYGGAFLAPRWMEKPPKRWEYYAAAAVNGLMVGALAYSSGLDRYFWTQLIFLTILTTASLVDLHDRIIPNELVIAGLVSGFILLVVMPYPDKSFLAGVGGAAAGFGFLLLLALLVKGGMGFGDVKLAAVIGLFLGFPWVGMGLTLAFLAGGVASVILLALRAAGRKDMIPFGPYLALGAALTVIYGPQIWSWYMNLSN